MTPQIEALDEASQTYRSIPASTCDKDSTVPPLTKYLASNTATPDTVKIRLTLYLDKEKPLSEPKWVKTGDIEDWLKSIIGSGGKLEDKDGKEHGTWSGKIIIADPDPVSQIL